METDQLNIGGFYEKDVFVFHAVDQKGFSDLFVYDVTTDSLLRLTNDYYDDKGYYIFNTSPCQRSEIASSDTLG